MKEWRVKGLKRVFLASMIGMGILAHAPAAWACSVCLSLTDRAREAYYGTTALLMLIPFLLLGGIFFWLRRAMKRQKESNERNILPRSTTTRQGSTASPRPIVDIHPDPLHD